MSFCRVPVVVLAGLLQATVPVRADPGTDPTPLSIAAPVDPSDLRWLAPAYSVEPGHRTDWQRRVDSALAVQRRRTLEVRQQLAGLGLTADALPEGCYGDEQCSRVLDASRLVKRFGSFRELQEAGRAAAPYVESFRRAATIATGVLAPSADAGADAGIVSEARRRLVHDQLLRLALVGVPGRPELPEDPSVAEVFAFALSADVRRVDAANVAFVGEFVAARGWPTAPTFTQETHRAFWLLAQHGDDFPALQVASLAAMERAYAGRDGLPVEYGYLYDRVMLKLSGKQRYGTQVRCADGQRVPEPLDGTAPVDELRARLGLGPVADYLAKFPPCSDRVG